MTRQLRRVALVMLGLFGALLLNLTYLQVLRAEDLRDDNRNARQLIREYAIRRGSIVAGAGGPAQEIARVEETGGRLRFLRVYDQGPRYAHVTGFYSSIYGRSELESSFNEFLIGSAPEVFARNLGDLLAGRQRVGDTLITTLRPEVQQAAEAALAPRAGAVVALDPTNGEILALYSSPSYDPNVLAAHDPEAVRAAWSQLEADPARPRINRAVREWYPPGSTFKLVTAAAALAAGIAPDTVFDDPREQELPQTTATISNFGGGLCNGGNPLTLRQALIVSCNTTFAQIGLNLGADALVTQAEAFGLNQEWDFHLPQLLVSQIPADLDPPSTAQSAIGQRDVRVTPLQMAMITAAIANDGVLMRPRLVKHVEDFAGRVIRQYPPEPLRLAGFSQPISREVAHILRDMMVAVVESGTGRRAALDGVAVAGKTGTAEDGDDTPTVWFVGFAPAEQARVVVAVVVEDGGEIGDEATGGAVAAPIARAVMAAALGTGG